MSKAPFHPLICVQRLPQPTRDSSGRGQPFAASRHGVHYEFAHMAYADTLSKDGVAVRTNFRCLDCPWYSAGKWQLAGSARLCACYVSHRRSIGGSIGGMSSFTCLNMLVGRQCRLQSLAELVMLGVVCLVCLRTGPVKRKLLCQLRKKKIMAYDMARCHTAPETHQFPGNPFCPI